MISSCNVTEPVLWKGLNSGWVLRVGMGELAVIGVYGYSKTGKTTLLTEIIRRLTAEGVRVATVKCTDKEVSLDTPGKDTSRHRKAGAGLVVLSSAGETDFVYPDTLSIHEITDMVADGGFGAFDLLLVEGAREPWIPKIRVGDCPKRPNTIGQCTGNVEEALELVRGVLRGRRAQSRLQVSVNGKEVPLTAFPELVMSNVILGMLGSLKGVGEVQHARLTLTCCPSQKE